LREQPFVRHGPDELEEISRQYRFGPLLYLIGFGLAFVSPAASIAACLVLAIFFAFAGRRHVLLTDRYRLGSATAGAG
jgi:TMEM175 potassium channel family protein